MKWALIQRDFRASWRPTIAIILSFLGARIALTLFFEHEIPLLAGIRLWSSLGAYLAFTSLFLGMALPWTLFRDELHRDVWRFVFSLPMHPLQWVASKWSVIFAFFLLHSLAFILVFIGPDQFDFFLPQSGLLGQLVCRFTIFALFVTGVAFLSSLFAEFESSVLLGSIAIALSLKNSEYAAWSPFALIDESVLPFSTEAPWIRAVCQTCIVTTLLFVLIASLITGKNGALIHWVRHRFPKPAKALISTFLMILYLWTFQKNTNSLLPREATPGEFKHQEGGLKIEVIDRNKEPDLTRIKELGENLVIALAQAKRELGRPPIRQLRFELSSGPVPYLDRALSSHLTVSFPRRGLASEDILFMGEVAEKLFDLDTAKGTDPERWVASGYGLFWAQRHWGTEKSMRDLLEKRAAFASRLLPHTPQPLVTRWAATSHALGHCLAASAAAVGLNTASQTWGQADFAHSLSKIANPGQWGRTILQIAGISALLPDGRAKLLTAWDAAWRDNLQALEEAHAAEIDPIAVPQMRLVWQPKPHSRGHDLKLIFDPGRSNATLVSYPLTHTPDGWLGLAERQLLQKEGTTTHPVLRKLTPGKRYLFAVAQRIEALQCDLLSAWQTVEVKP